jgi:hypothetical protein
MVGIRRVRLAGAALLLVPVLAACETGPRLEPSLPVAAGFRVDGGVLKLWTGTPCQGVIGLRMTFDSGTSRSTEQVWAGPEPGVPLERMDLLTTAGGPPAATDGPLPVRKPLPAEYDWTGADSINFAVDGPEAFGTRLKVAPILHESAQHPFGSYFFGPSGWMDASDVQRENTKSFLTICTPDPG